SWQTRPFHAPQYLRRCGTIARRAPSRAPLRSGGPSAAELLLQQFVQLGRIRFAAGRLHHLADEEAEELVLPRAVVGKLSGILPHHLVDHALDRHALAALPD